MRLRQSPHSWVLFSFGLILLGVTLLVTELGSPQFTDDNWTRFLGRLHPVVLHLPIGLFAGLCILEIIRLRDNTPGLAFAARVVLFLTAVSAVFAASFGLLLAANDDYTGSTAFWHKSLGVAFAAGTLVLLLLREENHEEHSRIRKAAYYGSLLTLSLLIGFVGHLGGSLTHGANYLTEYAPSWFAQRENLRDLSADAPTDSNDVYRNQIEPIFQQYCVSCHGPEKQKSRYRLDTFKNLLVAGSSQETPIVPGKPNESYLVELLWLPEEDDMAMPPEGKIRPSPEEILIITHWVAQGAPGPIVDEIAKQAQQREQSARIAAIDYLTQQDIVVLPMGQDLPHYYVDFLNVDTQPNDAIWTNLTTIKNQVEVLKLSTISSTADCLPRTSCFSAADPLSW
ncbi:MAG: c-type cytochrome domain-containing protein [Verrucomicrobiota bacterium]